MEIAFAVRQRADCAGQKVGAVIVLEERIISTGYNGTPEKMTNCSEGGCVRCANRGKVYTSGTAYDLCICVHAEQNAIISAARFGIGIQSATLYTTTQPCFGCLKEMLQARIRCVHYRHPWKSQRDSDHEQQYQALLKEFEDGVHQSAILDPREAWATAAGKPGTTVIDQHGMESI
jgi:dCMP deaminase